MAEPYNFTQVANTTTLPDLLVSMNTGLGEGWIGTILLTTLFIILLISFKNFEGSQAFAGAAFICAIMAIFLNLIGILATFVMVVYLVLASVGAVILLFRN